MRYALRAPGETRSDRIGDGVRRAGVGSASTPGASEAFGLRFTRIAGAPNVTSSTTRSRRNFRRSCLRRSRTSRARTWPARRGRMPDPSFSRSGPFFGALAGAFGLPAARSAWG